MKTIITGKVFKFGKNIDTDQIYPGRFVQYTDVADVAKYAMHGADPDFVKKVHPGDLIVAGTNFGCGSSREQAAVTLKAVGLSAVIAESFARIFYRNAINMGLPLITCPGINEKVKTGETITVDVAKGAIIDSNGQTIATIQPFSDYITNILAAGGIKPLLTARLAGEK